MEKIKSLSLAEWREKETLEYQAMIATVNAVYAKKPNFHSRNYGEKGFYKVRNLPIKTRPHILTSGNYSLLVSDMPKNAIEVIVGEEGTENLRLIALLSSLDKPRLSNLVFGLRFNGHGLHHPSIAYYQDLTTKREGLLQEPIY
jgi:hypothetical protein